MFSLVKGQNNAYVASSEKGLKKALCHWLSSEFGLTLDEADRGVISGRGYQCDVSESLPEPYDKEGLMLVVFNKDYIGDRVYAVKSNILDIDSIDSSVVEFKSLLFLSKLDAEVNDNKDRFSFTVDYGSGQVGGLGW